MKRITVIICFVLITSSLFSCTSKKSLQQIHDSDVIIQKYGFSGGMADISVDLNNFVDITEMSSQIIECTVIETKNIKVNDLFDLVFTYSIKVDDIFLDTSGKLKNGDVLEIMTTEGYIKAADIYPLMLEKDAERARKLGLFTDRDYKPNEYVLSSSWDAIPMEVGRTYIVYLTDQFFDKQGVYSECGYSYLFDVTESDVYWRSDLILYDLKRSDLITTIQGYISARTGRADQLGWSQYMAEVQAERITN